MVSIPAFGFGVELRLLHLRAREEGSAHCGARVETSSVDPRFWYHFQALVIATLPSTNNTRVADLILDRSRWWRR